MSMTQMLQEAFKGDLPSADNDTSACPIFTELVLDTMWRERAENSSKPPVLLSYTQVQANDEPGPIASYLGLPGRRTRRQKPPR